MSDIDLEALRRQAEKTKLLIDKMQECPLEDVVWNKIQTSYLIDDHRETLLTGPNQGGKTFTQRYMLFMHLTGRYPSWYTGPRFHEPPYIWVLSVSGDRTQELYADKLFGRFDNRGGGDLPSSWVDPDLNLVAQPGGGKGQLREATVPWFGADGERAGWSIVRFGSYAGGPHLIQGPSPNAMLLDEEPPYEVYTECSARLNYTRGILRMVGTPTRGVSPIRTLFKGEGKFHHYIPYTIYDCTHLPEDHRAELLEKYPPGTPEYYIRLCGEAFEGSALVFPVDLTGLCCEEREINPSSRCVIGTDLNHTPTGTFAATKVSLSGEDMLTVHSSHKLTAKTRPDHADLLFSLGGQRIPVAWPHDGNRADGSANSTIIQNYKNKFNLNFMTKHAQYKTPEGKWSRDVRPILDDIYDRMVTGRIEFVGGTATRELIDELQKFETKDGKIKTRQDDHCVDALVKAVMMVYKVPQYADIVGPAIPRAHQKVVRHRDFFTKNSARRGKRSCSKRY